MAGPDSPFIGASATKNGNVSLGPISGIKEWNFWENDPKQGDDPAHSVTTTQAYSRVPWLFRSVNLRANTIADMPWSIMKGKTEIVTSDKDDERIGTLPQELSWIKPVSGKGTDPTQDSLVDLLRKTELDLCLHGAAYWKRDSNRVRTRAFRRFLPQTIRPIFDPDAGLVDFVRTVPGAAEGKRFTTDELVWWWLPAVEAELGPGVSPATVALRAAGLMANIDTYAEGFFQRGAINTTILTVEGNPPRSELDRLEQWWKRLLGGVRKAFETIAVKASIKPIVVGQAPKDLALDTLTEAKRRDVSTAIGVPMSVLDDKSANFATAKVSLLSFYHLTVMPELEVVEGGLNRQIFSPLGYEFRFHPELIEALEEEEAMKAYKLLALVVGGVITVNEMRDEMTYPPSTDPGADHLRQTAVPGVAPDMAGPTPHSDGREATIVNQQLPRGSIGANGTIPTSDRQVERQQNLQAGVTRGDLSNKAMDAAAFFDVLQALAPPPALKSRIRKMIERDAEGRITGVTEEAEAEVATLVEPFRSADVDEGGDPYP